MIPDASTVIRGITAVMEDIKTKHPCFTLFTQQHPNEYQNYQDYCNFSLTKWRFKNTYFDKMSKGEMFQYEKWILFKNKKQL